MYKRYAESKQLMLFHTQEGRFGSWSYGGWIYNYICNQCISPLTLCVWIPLRQGVLVTTLCDKSFSVSYGRMVVFWLPQYNWNIIESGVKHHKLTTPIHKKTRSYLLIQSDIEWLLKGYSYLLYTTIHQRPIGSYGC